MGEREPGMGHEQLHKHEAYELLRERYAEYEDLDQSTVERFLEYGEIRNIAPIESLGQPVSEHKDEVYIGSMVKEHKDLVFEGELVLPDFDKPLLVVCKPDSGVNEGTFMQASKLWIPEAASVSSNKETASWILIRDIGMGHLSEPTVKRQFDTGDGSVRPYIWGHPLDIASMEDIDDFYDDLEAMEDIAFVDYHLQPADRKPANMMLAMNKEKKLIDHTLTFLG